MAFANRCGTDDSAATGTIKQLHAWWNKLAEHGPLFGYFPNPTKTWIVVKQEHQQEASRVFVECGINITTKGRPCHGAPIGTEDDVTE